MDQIWIFFCVIETKEDGTECILNWYDKNYFKTAYRIHGESEYLNQLLNFLLLIEDDSVDKLTVIEDITKNNPEIEIDIQWVDTFPVPSVN